MQTVEYAPGRHADLFGTGAGPTVLIWHGMQTDSRGAVRALAQMVADRGLAVVAADWDAHADDAGRADLLGSVRFAQQRSAGADEFVVVGWSMGGLAAAGLALQAAELDLRIGHTVCLAGAFMAPEPFTGETLPASLPRVGRRSPFLLLHGTRDDVVPVTASREFAAALRRDDWPVDLVELDTDHAAIAGATYDPVADRYEAAEDAAALAVAADVAARIAAVATPRG
ncbi:alpha/beta fold hydrolase [Mycobacterium sp. NPDC050551]|uniref:alpha/beta hydrolase family protein n=1 Tax=Mycobacterium sp. NPDC050551 TaxID=3155407 RepID=UPI003415679B